VPDGYYTVPIGKAEIVRKGADLTVVTYGTGTRCRGSGKAKIDAEIIDIRTMLPSMSTRLHGEENRCCVVAHEATGLRFRAVVSDGSEECFGQTRADRASPVGIRRIRTCSSGTTFRDRRA
jgi:2-oxoisovalerate dehydrogenase E1 component beta subunit